MISIRQMRAARALLGWKQSDLAKISGLSLTALNNIERSAVSPRFATMDLICESFEKNGIQFTEDDGVKMRSDLFDVRTFEGNERDCILTYFRDVLDTLKRDGGYAGYGGVDESFFIDHYRQETFEFYQELTREKLKEKILICEGVSRRYGPKSTSEYRALPHELFGMISYSVYGNKYTLLLTGKKKSRWISIEHKGVAEVHRQIFETHWKMGKYVPYTRPLYEDDLERSGFRKQ